MKALLRGLGTTLKSHELLLVWLLGVCVFVSAPIFHGGLSLSSDALNHHFYLGWMAHNQRLLLDFMPASYQSYQAPYLYWPLYQLASNGASGLTAGIVLAILATAAIPPVWIISKWCIPGDTGFDVLMRLAAIILSFMSSIVLLQLTTTSNDLFAAIPLLWAIALAKDTSKADTPPSLRTALSGFLAGIAVAVKLSNAPLAIVLPIVWFQGGHTLTRQARMLVLGGLSMMSGFFAGYGYWGMLLWERFGNPIFPLYDHWFVPIRNLVGWSS